jgi:phage terminase large subunit-like protein
VELRPHVEVVGLWEKPKDWQEPRPWKVPRSEVKEAIRAACRRWSVVEIAWDEFLWLDTAEELEEEGLRVQRFGQTPAMTVPATQRVYEDLVFNDGTARPTGFTHSGHEGLRRHVANARTKTDSRGTRLMKDPMSPERIDAAVALIMARARAAWHLQQGLVPNIH